MKIIHPIESSEFFHDCRINIEKLQPYQSELIIVNCASEHWGTDINFLLNVCNALENNNFNFWVLSYHYKDHAKHPKLIYYPWWYIFSYKKFKKINISSRRNKIFGCSNFSPRPHRISNYLRLQEKVDTNKFHITIHGFGEITPRSDDIDLTDLEIKQWNSLSNVFTNPEKPHPESLMLPPLNDAYVHLTTETTVIDRIFITEKTWKPIAAGQLFLQFGNPGSVEFLRSLGVDTFDDIIDHNSYDHIQDWRQRLERIHNIILELMDQNIEDIWDRTLYRRELNKERFFAGEFRSSYQYETLDPLLEPYVLSLHTPRPGIPNEF